MKVLYDSQAFDMQTHGGVSRCFAELYSHLPQDIEASLSVMESANVYLQTLGSKPDGELYHNFLWKKDSAIKKMLYKFYYNAKFGEYSRLDRTPRINRYKSVCDIKSKDFDLFHPTFFDPYFLKYIGSKPYVVTVHDMIPELYNQYYDHNDYQILQKHLVIPKANHIIAVSQQTKRDLCRIMNIKEEQVSVVYHGADETPYTPSENNRHPFEYILFVGERHFYKNFDFFAKQCVPILKRHKELKVVCTGKPFNETEKSMFKSWEMEDRFIHEFIKTDQEMLDLYHYALAFVYPSSYEGFGLPILEAYKAECPVLLNHASCFPEIAEDAAVYFHMDEKRTDFEEQFETFYYLDGIEKKKLIEKQNERLKHFSWKKSALELANIYKHIV